jgi:UDP-2,4-diacetamido-2,4,6-trideoxy-beta-L-altropyranose hydrolase
MIVFRTDSSLEIGTGHVTRCLSLADKLKALGLMSHFVCRDVAGHLGERIRDKGYGLSLISNSTNDQELILSLKPQWVVVDHYALDESWEKALTDAVPVFVIDDLMNRRHCCRILVDQNFHQEAEARYRPLVGTSTRLLLGPQFALFNLPSGPTPVRKYQPGPKKILVFFGGADASDETSRFLRALQVHPTSHFFQIVVTTTNRKVDEFRKISRGSNFEIFISPATWQDLLKNADCFLGSGGTVTWERMNVGLPGMVVSVAENQTEIAQDLHRSGYQIFLGPSQQLQYSEVLAQLEKFLQDIPLLQKMSDAGLRLVRPFPNILLEEIFIPVGARDFQMKIATLQDSRFLFDLRNDPQTRAMSRSTDIVDWETHSRWLEKKLIAPKTRLYVAFVKGQPAGQFRVDASGETSIAIAAAFRGQGLSSRIIREGCALYAAEFQPEHPLTAQIRPENQASLRSFQSAGFRIFNDSKVNESDYITLTLETK